MWRVITAGLVIRQALFGLPAKVRTDHIPWATYTDPELAQVGLTEAEACEAHGDRVEVARFDYAGNDRAIAEGQNRGVRQGDGRQGAPDGRDHRRPSGGRAYQSLGIGVGQPSSR